MTSIDTGFPNKREKESITHGKYGAVKVMRPKTLILTSSFRLPHTYVIIKVNADPKKLWTWTRGATMAITNIPKKSISTKFEVLPRKSPSSSSLQYRTKKYMWKRKSTENSPKNMKLENNRQTWPSKNIKSKLKYREYGLIRSIAQPAVVRKADVK